MNDAQMLERLRSAYATVEAPAPNAALAELLESGEIGRDVDDDERRDAVVVPLVRPRAPVRMRHLVAAMVATFVLFSGLAVAGALPDPVQRQVSSVVGHLGIDLPSPASSPSIDAPASPNAPDHPTSTSSSTGAPSTGADGATGSPGANSATGTPTGGTLAPGATPTTSPSGTDLGDVGAVTGETPPTTVPSNPGGLLELPPIALPPINLPPLTLPPITLPQLPIPLPSLPILGL
ncbi:MAG TPA: hypothetical protein VGN51_16625 [Acidimicrobiia bacterium]|jgi:hypothetical protein